MTVREIALKLLDEYEIEGKYVNLSLQSHTADALNREDRALLTSLLYTVTEHKITYDYYISYLAERSIEKIDISTKNILRLGLCQLIDMDKIPTYAAVNETVSLVKKRSAKGFVNGVLRRAVRELDSLPLPPREKNAARHLSVKYSFSLPIVRLFISELGESSAEKLLSHYNTERGISLAVNTKRITRDEFINKLLECGISAEKSPYSDISVRVGHSLNPVTVPGFNEGYFFVQDDACTASVIALSPTENDRIIDVCSCPGGKSFAAAALSGDNAEIFAFDISESKLPLITSGAERLGLTSVSARTLDATLGDEELFGTADKVICDVPCSGLGVLGKKPDMRYKKADAWDELPAMQYEILKTSAKYLKRGGVLVYSTCTLNSAENSDVVARFLHENKDFSAVDFKVGEYTSMGGMFTFLPHVHGTDGFFIAKIRKDV